MFAFACVWSCQIQNHVFHVLNLESLCLNGPRVRSTSCSSHRCLHLLKWEVSHHEQILAIAWVEDSLCDFDAFRIGFCFWPCKSNCAYEPWFVLYATDWLVYLWFLICSFWWDIFGHSLTFCKCNLPIASDLCTFSDSFWANLVLRFGNSHSGTFGLSWRCLTCWATAPKLHKLMRQPNFVGLPKTWGNTLGITSILQAHSTSCCLEWCWAAGVGAKKSQAGDN